MVVRMIFKLTNIKQNAHFSVIAKFLVLEKKDVLGFKEMSQGQYEVYIDIDNIKNAIEILENAPKIQ